MLSELNKLLKFISLHCTYLNPTNTTFLLKCNETSEKKQEL